MLEIKTSLPPNAGNGIQSCLGMLNLMKNRRVGWGTCPGNCF